jgi:hypothetical protein
MRKLEQQLSHLLVVVRCQDSVISVAEFEQCQSISTDATAAAAAAAARGTTTLQSMSDFIQDFTWRNADIFSRSVMNLLILGPLTRSVVNHDKTQTLRPAQLLGRDPMDEVIVSDLLEYGILPWMIQSDSGQHSLSFIIPATLNGLRLQCLAPSRLHRRTSALLKDWGVLLNDCDYYDGQMLTNAKIPQPEHRLYANRFGSYVLDMTLDVMRRQLSLGFVLDLYVVSVR